MKNEDGFHRDRTTKGKVKLPKKLTPDQQNWLEEEKILVVDGMISEKDYARFRKEFISGKSKRKYQQEEED